MSAEPGNTTEEKLEAALRQLQSRLGMVDFLNRQSAMPSGMELLVIRFYPTAIRIDNSNKHGRPHFHIEYKQEFSASYAIDTFERLAGFMPAKYSEPLLEWAKAHQAVLYAKWEETHPEMPVYAKELKGT